MNTRHHHASIPAREARCPWDMGAVLTWPVLERFEDYEGLIECGEIGRN